MREREGGPGVRCRHLLECRAAEGVSVSPALLAGERGLPLGTLVYIRGLVCGSSVPLGLTVLVGKFANAPLLDVGYLPWKGRQSAAAPVAAAARRLHSARGLAELMLGAVPPVHCCCL